MIAYFEKYFCDTKANTSSEIENFNTANGNVRWLKLRRPVEPKWGSCDARVTRRRRGMCHGRNTGPDINEWITKRTTTIPGS